MPKDIHDIERRFKTALENFNKDDRISNFNKKLFAKYLGECKIGFFGEEIGTPRMGKYLYHFKQICLWLKRDIKSEDGLADAVALAKIIDETALKFNTKRDFRIFIKKFWKWLNGEEWTHSNLKWVRTTVKHNEKTLPEDIPTEQEILQLIEGARNLRDKFFISFLYETAARIGEAGTIRFKDLKINNGDSEVKLKGKTGERLIPLFSCIPYARQYLAVAPFKDNPDGAVFNNSQSSEPMSYTSLINIIKAACGNAKINKHFHPHIFRHAKLTWLEGNGNFNEAMLCAFAGWTIGSDMARTYVHLSKKTLKDALRRVSLNEDKPMEPVMSSLSPITCRFCQLENPPTLPYCERCGNALTVEGLKESKEKQRSIMLEAMQGEFAKLKIEMMAELRR